MTSLSLQAAAFIDFRRPTFQHDLYFGENLTLEKLCWTDDRIRLWAISALYITTHCAAQYFRPETSSKSIIQTNALKRS
ncbi:hypothetical protein C0J52_25887 [Blattella germanica]|nr:hypothetical protein C0J52_25887 [Blattella germanica]